MPNKNDSNFEGEDYLLKSILRDVNKGFYLDIGANHPGEFIAYSLCERGIDGF